MAVVEPDATVIDAGTAARDVLLLDSATTAPSAGAAAVSVTVAVIALPPETDVDARVTLLKAAVVVDGDERARLGRGDFFGEISALTGDVPTADIRAETMLRCLMLPGPQLEAFLLEHPMVMLRMLHAEARRVRDANRWR